MYLVLSKIFFNPKIIFMRHYLSGGRTSLSFVGVLFFMFMSPTLHAQVHSIKVEVGKTNNTLTVKDPVTGITYIDPAKALDYVVRYKSKRQRRVNKKVLFFGGHQDAFNIFFDADKISGIIANGMIAAKANGTK